MTIITIASTKGGVGKSTLVTNLATMLKKQGVKIAILDADLQGTVSKWNKIREYMIGSGEKLDSFFVASASGETLIEIANDKKSQGYTVLIDSPGVNDQNMRSAILRSDYILTPCSTSSAELWEIETLISIVKNLSSIQKRRLPLILLFNKAPCIHTENSISNAQNFLSENMIFPNHIIKECLRDRIVYKNSMRDGRGVVEFVPIDLKANDEIEKVADELVTIIKGDK